MWGAGSLSPLFLSLNVLRKQTRNRQELFSGFRSNLFVGKEIKRLITMRDFGFFRRIVCFGAHHTLSTPSQRGIFAPWNMQKDMYELHSTCSS
jgi:hypothetical protein